MDNEQRFVAKPQETLLVSLPNEAVEGLGNVDPYLLVSYLFTRYLKTFVINLCQIMRVFDRGKSQLSVDLLSADKAQGGAFYSDHESYHFLIKKL